MAIVHMWCGAPTSTSVRVIAKVENGPQASLWVSTSDDMSGAVEADTIDEISGDDIAQLAASSLTPDTRYWYRVADDGVIDTSMTGTFRTHPLVGQPANFKFWVSSCAGGGVEDTGDIVQPVLANRISNHPVFETIRSQAVADDWLLGVHLGDMHYYDLGSNLHGISGGGSLANYRRGYDDLLQQTRQRDLYSQVPLAYIYDDHDWGPNNSASTIPGRSNAIQSYRERVPHYPLGSPAPDTPNYQSWQIGRVLFVLTDLRADRDPNSTPAGPNKTMLGAAQKAWFKDILATSQASFLVWLSSSQWLGTGSDAWGNFTHERDELLAAFAEHGWLHRMMVIYGDNHNMGIASAGHNPLGGFPVFQVSPLDTSPSTGTPSRWDVGHVNNQIALYGTITITDNGDTIQVRLDGWQNGLLRIGHVFSVDATAGPEPPAPPSAPPAPPSATQAVIRTRVTWLGCDLASGHVIAELPDITGDVEKLIGQPRSNGLMLPIPRAGPGALPIQLVEQVIVPGRTMIVAVVNDIPMWAGIVMGPTESGTDATVSLPCVTLEGYLDRRIVRDHVWVNQDVASVIAAGLVADAQDIPGVGIGIGLVVDAPSTGVLFSREYSLTDRRSVLQALQELTDAESGPEWTIDVDWEDANNRNVIQKIFRVRQRLGTAAPEGEPLAVFQTTAHSVFQTLSSAEARYRFRQDYGFGKGATYVVAYSSGQGEDQPSSMPAVATELLNAGFPIYEQHYQPATDIIDTAVLNAHAQAELSRRRSGFEAFHLEVRWDAYPRYGIDWRLGDDVAWQLIGHRHPNGIQGQGRVIGFSLDMQRQIIVPILHDEGA